jgi:predicted DNA-binding protein (MmcQ/YjbR family)
MDMHMIGGGNPTAALIAGVIAIVMLIIFHRNERKSENSMLHWVQESQSKALWLEEFDTDGGTKAAMEALIDYCLAKQGATKEYPFGPEPLVAKVGGKMFALVSGASISLKCDPVIAENLREQYEAVTPGYHLSKKHWNSIHVDGSIPEEELKDMIDHSYGLVLKGLPKAIQNRINQKSQTQK